MCDSFKVDCDDKVCRSCLSPAEDMKSLNDPYSAEMCVAEVFTCVTSLECSEDNNVLPAQICRECFGQLHSSYQFVLKSRESDKKLHTYLKKIHKTNERKVADNITKTDGIRSVKSENVTHLTATTLLKTGHSMNALIEEIQLNDQTELDNLSNDLILNNRALSTERGIKLEEYQSNHNINESSYESIQTLRTPLSITEMQNDLDQEIELIKHEIDIVIKTEISNDINIAINNESDHEQVQLLPRTRRHPKIQDESKNVCIELAEPPYLCTFCERSFSKRVELTKHRRTHIKEHTCAVCNKSFSRKNELINHTRIHTGEKPYSCTACNMSFSLKANLMRHVRTHTKEKKYACTICNKSFNHKPTLTYHTRIHTGEKPYSCTVCNKSFSLKLTLVNHVRIHNGENPFTCTVCNKTFYQKSSLVHHAQIHTRKEPYSCRVCKRNFNHKSSLNRHSRTHTTD